MRIIILSFIVFSQTVFAQIETIEQNMLESKSLLREIIKDNNFRNGNFEVKLGYFTMTGDPRGESVKLNSGNRVPYVEFSGDYIFWRRFGLAGSIQRAQNLLSDSTTNTASSSQNYYILGAIYKRVLDETNVKNYFSVKLQYYNNSNNFKTIRTDAQFVKAYTGLLLGLERVIPATSLYDIKGGLDIIMITDAKSDAEEVYFKKTGNGLAFNLAGYYNMNRKSRLGLGMGILAYFNSVKDKDSYGKNTYTQSYRNLYFTYNYLF